MSRRPDPREGLERALTLAFADAVDESAPVDEPAAAWAETLGLAERIADRVPSRAPDRWRDALRRQASGAILLEVALERAAEAAVASETCLVLLKGMALIRGGFAGPGRRALADLDLLVASEAASGIEAALLADGFTAFEDPEGGYHHHRTPLIHPELGVVELHTRLPGVRLDDAEATAGAVLQGDRTTPDPELDGIRVPRAELLAAHAIAHCLYQERHVGSGIGFFRMVGDLIDLEREGGLEGAVSAAEPFLAKTVPAGDLTALAALVRSVRAGRYPTGAADAEAMLDRFVAAAVRPAETRRRLRWKRRWHVLRMRGGWRKLLARVAGRR